MFGGKLCARTGEARCLALPNEEYCLRHHPYPEQAHARVLALIADQKGARGSCLRGLSFESVNWPEYEFSKCDLSGILLRGGTLAGARIHFCLFTDATLTNVMADGITLDFCALTGGRIEGCEFTGSNITLVAFNNTSIIDSRYDGSDLFHSRFIGAKLKSVGMVDCNLKGVDFRGSTSEYVRFKYSNVEDAMF